MSTATYQGSSLKSLTDRQVPLRARAGRQPRHRRRDVEPQDGDRRIEPQAGAGSYSKTAKTDRVELLEGVAGIDECDQAESARHGNPELLIEHEQRLASRRGAEHVSRRQRSVYGA